MSPGVSTPLVTVGIPIYNSEKWIDELISNLNQQTYPNIEFIFADNASTDRSYEFIEEQIKSAANMKIFKNKSNLGAIANINNLMARASGEYFVIWAADDVKTKNFITACVAALDRKEQNILCLPHTRMIFGEDSKCIADINIREKDFSGNVGMRYSYYLWNLPAISLYGMFRMNAIKELGPIPIMLGGDVAYLQSLMLIGDIVSSKEATFNFRIRDTWNTREQDLRFFFGDSQFEDRRFPFVQVYQSMFRFIVTSKISFLAKFICFFFLSIHLLVSKLHRIFLLLMSKLFSRNAGLNLAIKYYYTFLHSSYFCVLDQTDFRNRIILPSLKYWSL